MIEKIKLVLDLLDTKKECIILHFSNYIILNYTKKAFDDNDFKIYYDISNLNWFEIYFNDNHKHWWRIYEGYAF